MKNKIISKLIITFGLLLFITLLTQFITPIGVIAQAAEVTQSPSIDKEKNNYRLNLKNITIVKGKTFSLKVYYLKDTSNVSFKSSNPEIVSISDDGTLTANAVGSASITATVVDDTGSYDLTCDITVGPPAFSVKLTKSRIILEVDKIDLLKVILKPSNTAETARFSSYNDEIVSVSSGGRVTAKKPGLTYVFAEIDAVNPDGQRKFTKCTVIVTTEEDAPLLENFFNEHPELNLISELDLTLALEEFFNNLYDPANPEEDPLVEALYQFLNEMFNLDELQKTFEQNKVAQIPINQIDVIAKGIRYVKTSYK